MKPVKWGSALLVALVALAGQAATLRPTMYSTKVTNDQGGGSRSTVKVLRNGRIQSVSVPRHFRSKLALEGAGILIDRQGQRRVLSYWKPGVYKELAPSDYPAGGTARSVNRRQCPRVPFKTIAVGSGIPLGSKIFIPQTKGMRFPLPGGGTYEHDGIWYAEDRGGAIGSGRVDMFLGNQWGSEIEGRLNGTFNTSRRLRYERYGRINKCAADVIPAALYSKLTGGGAGGGSNGGLFRRLSAGH